MSLNARDTDKHLHRPVPIYTPFRLDSRPTATAILTETIQHQTDDEASRAQCLRALERTGCGAAGLQRFALVLCTANAGKRAAQMQTWRQDEVT